jgi:hypothetical protein
LRLKVPHIVLARVTWAADDTLSLVISPKVHPQAYLTLFWSIQCYIGSKIRLPEVDFLRLLYHSKFIIFCHSSLRELWRLRTGSKGSDSNLSWPNISSTLERQFTMSLSVQGLNFVMQIDSCRGRLFKLIERRERKTDV